MDIGQRLQEVLSEKSMSYSDAALLIGAQKGLISNWVNNVSKPSRPRLYLLAQKLNINFDWLLSGIGEKYSNPPEMFSALKEEEIKYISRNVFEDEIISLKAQNSLLKDQLREKDLIIKDLHMELARLREECHDKNKKGRRSA